MANRVCAGVVATAATAALLTAGGVDGHAHQQFPMSRQYSRSNDFYDHKYDLLEGAPYAYNAGGVKDVQDRAQRLTSQDVLDKTGGGKIFPLYFMDLAENGNYLETNEVAKRHGVCGDPRLGREDSEMPYSTPNSEWEVIDTFEGGQEIEIDVVVVYYHWGHFEFFLCDTKDLDDPDGVVTQECLNKYPLTRVYNANDASTIDPNYPGRYYTDPPCRKDEVEQNVSDNIPASPYNVKMRYRLPDIECDHCVLQMHYLTGNRCKHIGYNDFDPDSWNSKCAPDTADWIDLDMSICGEGASYPEEFWACSDIALLSGGAPETPAEPETPATPSPVTAVDETPSPVTPETPSPVTPETPSPVAEEEEETPSPVTPTTPAPYTPAEEEEPSTPAPYSSEEPEADESTPSPVTPIPEADEFTPSPVTPTPEEDDSEAGAVTYMGCWQDERGERTMEAGYATADGMSNEECIAYCSMDEKMYAGTSNDYSCWCTNDEQKIYRHGESDQCTEKCTHGDGTEICGGLLAVSVYSTGFVKPMATVPDIDGATYLGCFKDERGARTGEFGFVNGDDMTNQECIDFCRDDDKAFAGVLHDYSCWCTNDERKISRHGESDECDEACSGDELQVCGGSLAVTTWATGLAPASGTDSGTDDPTSDYAYPE